MILVVINFSIFIRALSSNPPPCENGGYGHTCQIQCSGGCAAYNGVVQCDRSSGICLDGCNGGWYGEKCHKMCSKHCLNRICHEHDGRCTLGCEIGMHGDYCDDCDVNVCGSNCSNCPSRAAEVTTPSNDNQISVALETENDCGVHKWGNHCEYNCTTGCIEGSCNRTDGKCVCDDAYCGMPNCQPCSTTLPSSFSVSITSAADKLNIVQYVSTFVVITSVLLSLLFCLVAITFVYFIYCRKRNGVKRQNLEERTRYIKQEEEHAVIHQPTTDGYCDIDETLMDAAPAAKPSPCLNKQERKTEEKTPDRRYLPCDDGGTDGYEPVSAAPALEVTEVRENEDRFGTSYLKPILYSDN